MSAPDRSEAWMTSVPTQSPETILFRLGKAAACGGVEGGTSLSTHPC